MDKILLKILMLKESMTFNSTYTLVLGEKNGPKRFSLVLGKMEAQVIAISLDGLKPPRPLTHDLMYHTLKAFNIEIIEILITKLSKGVFYSVIICKKGEKIIELDSRTSDALALALRFNCPIYTTKQIINTIGVDVEEEKQQTIEQFEEELEEDLRGFVDIDIEEIINKNEFDGYSNKDLQDLMKKALLEENYEYAAKVRDELDKRNKI